MRAEIFAETGGYLFRLIVQTANRLPPEDKDAQPATAGKQCSRNLLLATRQPPRMASRQCPVADYPQSRQARRMIRPYYRISLRHIGFVKALTPRRL